MSHSNYLCNLIIPGAAKSGTSSLHDFLNLHPEIEMSNQKEPHFFSMATEFQKGPKHHNSFFSQKNKEKYYGESSTSYLVDKYSIERISEEKITPKVIFLLRHPVDRCISHYKWRVRLGLEKRDLITAVKIDGYGFDARFPTKFGYMAYLQYSNYSKLCTRWEDMIGSNNCLYINSHDLQTHRQNTLNRCFSFLSVNEFELPPGVSDANLTDQVNKYPNKLELSLYKYFPNSFKRNKYFRSILAKYSKLKSSKVDIQPSQDEINFIYACLSQDVMWFEQKFF